MAKSGLRQRDGTDGAMTVSKGMFFDFFPSDFRIFWRNFGLGTPLLRLGLGTPHPESYL